MELLELYLSPQDAQRFQAIATHVPIGLGDASTECLLPFWNNGQDRRKTIIKILESTRFCSENFLEIGEQDWMEQVGILRRDRQHYETDYLQRIGASLYRSLFPPDSRTKDTLQQCLRFAEQRNTEVHLRLKFAADSVQRSRLADYPWELLHDGQRFLLHQRVRLSRYIAYEASSPNLSIQATVRVLLITARPQKLPQLPQEEQQAIQDGLQRAQDANLVQLNILSPATYKALNHYLTDCSAEQLPQVLHFDGHGMFGKRCADSTCQTLHPGIKAETCRACGQPLPAPQGYLVFETEQGMPDYQSATQIAALLQPYPIALVVLSACQSAMAVAGDSVFNGMAQNLIDQRIPAVVAMQYSVQADAARDFAEQFYRVLGKQEPLLTAMNQGIRVMNVQGNQWYRPVLYLRWPGDEGGQLFASQTQTGKLSKWLNSRFTLAILTGIGVTVGVLLVRLLGFLEPMELSVYDHLLRIRPQEPNDSRLTIIAATKEDLDAQRSRGETPSRIISVQALKTVLQMLAQDDFRPAAIVLDLYRDNFGTNDPLADTFRSIQEHTDLFVPCEFPNSKSNGVAPPLKSVISPEHVGFSNFIPDPDKVLRRQLIEMPPYPGADCQSSQSLSFIVALRYIEKQTNQDLTYNQLWTPENNLILNGTQIKRISTFAFGGYQYVDANGVQFLLNYRAPNKDLTEITQQLLKLEDVRNGKISSKYFKGRIVLIGVTDETAAVDYVQTPYGEAAGVTVHAHMISQLISAALDKRPLIWVWSQWEEVVWTLLWGLTGSFLTLYPRFYRVSLIISGVGVCIICIYGAATVIMIWKTGWIPVLPPIFALILSVAVASYFHHKITSLHNI